MNTYYRLVFIKPSVKHQTKALLSAALEISRLNTNKASEAKSSIQLSQQVEHLLSTKERESGTLEKRFLNRSSFLQCICQPHSPSYSSRTIVPRSQQTWTLTKAILLFNSSFFEKAFQDADVKTHAASPACTSTWKTTTALREWINPATNTIQQHVRLYRAHLKAKCDACLFLSLSSSDSTEALGSRTACTIVRTGALKVLSKRKGKWHLLSKLRAYKAAYMHNIVRSEKVKLVDVHPTLDSEMHR